MEAVSLAAQPIAPFPQTGVEKKTALDNKPSLIGLSREGLGAASRRALSLGPEVLNLSERGRAWATRLGGPLALYARLAAFVNSPSVQACWAPAFGASRSLPVNERCLASVSGWESIAQANAQG